MGNAKDFKVASNRKLFFGFCALCILILCVSFDLDSPISLQPADQEKSQNSDDPNSFLDFFQPVVVDNITTERSIRTVTIEAPDEQKNKTVQGFETFECPDGPIVSVENGGRLGNKIWEYASAWTVAKLLNRTAFVPKAILDELTLHFDRLTFTTPLEEVAEKCHIAMEPPVQRSQLFPLETLDLRFKGRNILIPVYSILLELIVHQRDAFRREFRFNDKIMRNVDKTIQSLGGAGKTLIGVHVRRTDFKSYLPKAFKTHLVAASYFKKAMQWYRNEISGPLLFLIVTDDVVWCRQHLLGRDDVKIATKKPAHDLALMGVCNHTIIDYGTFGYSGAFFSKGHSISLDVDKLFAETMAKEAAWTIFSIQNLKEVKFESAKKLKKPVS